MAEPRTRTTIGVRHVRRVAVKYRMLQKTRNHDHRHASGGTRLSLLPALPPSWHRDDVS